LLPSSWQFPCVHRHSWPIQRSLYNKNILKFTLYWVHSKLRMALASKIILSSGSHGIHDHSSFSDFSGSFQIINHIFCSEKHFCLCVNVTIRIMQFNVTIATNRQQCRIYVNCEVEWSWISDRRSVGQSVLVLGRPLWPMNRFYMFFTLTYTCFFM
jgi:hypothetical protein